MENGVNVACLLSRIPTSVTPPEIARELTEARRGDEHDECFYRHVAALVGNEFTTNLNGSLSGPDGKPAMQDWGNGPVKAREFVEIPLLLNAKFWKDIKISTAPTSSVTEEMRM